MPPKVKFQKEEIINTALDIVRQDGHESLTARQIAKKMGVSTRPIFTYYDSMKQLKDDVFELAKQHYRTYISRGLDEPIPFLGVGHQYIRFAKEEGNLFKMLFLANHERRRGGAMESLSFSIDLILDSVMEIYKMDAYTAECYYRDLLLLAFGFATLIVTDDCPYTDKEISSILSEVSLSLCKAFKEIPGLAKGEYDKDAIFSKLVKQ